MSDDSPIMATLSNAAFDDGNIEKAKLILEQYKLYVEMADRISARRLAANSFFLSINTAILAIVGYIKSACGQSLVTQDYWLIAFAGIFISYSWHTHIRSYRDLNSAKFDVVHEIEKLLPLKPYYAEWEAVGRGKNPELYKPVSHIEMGIPWVFSILNTVVFLWLFPWQDLLKWIKSAFSGCL